MILNMSSQLMYSDASPKKVSNTEVDDHELIAKDLVKEGIKST